MIETLLALGELALPYIVSGIGLAIAWIVGKGWLTKKFGEALKEDIGAAVTMTYHEYVKERKDSAKDGKLTDEEAKNARQMAVNNLIAIGKAKGKDYAKEHLLPNIMNLIEVIVTKKKNGDE